MDVFHIRPLNFIDLEVSDFLSKMKQRSVKQRVGISDRGIARATWQLKGYFRNSCFL